MTIIIENLSFSYTPRHLVLRDVSAIARSGRITAVLGPNAAGKSTMLKCVIGALKPARGRVLIDDRNVHAMSPRQLARHIAYVPQRSIVSAAFTVRQVIELGRYALPANSRRVDDAIRRLDLVDVEDRAYPALSVGQQQRVTLARAVAQLSSDGHLVLDEPMSAMDLQHVSSTVKLLRELTKGGATVVLATHDLSLAAAIADDAWLLCDGAVVSTGPVGDVLTIERLRSVFGVDFRWIEVPNGPPRLLPEIPVSAGTDRMVGR